MARSKKMEPILIHHRADKVQTQLQKLNEKNNALEQALIELKKIFPDKLTDKQVVAIIKNGWENEIKKVSGYESGDVETILKLWGKHKYYQTTKAAITTEVKSYVTFSANKFSLKNGKATTTDKTIQEIKESENVYATTEKQIERYNDLKVLADALNYVLDKGFIYCSPSLAYGKTIYTRIREFDQWLSIENDKVVPNYIHIINLKE